MYTQKQMRVCKRDQSICHSIIKREKMKDAYVTCVHCGCGNPDAMILMKKENDKL